MSWVVTDEVSYIGEAVIRSGDRIIALVRKGRDEDVGERDTHARTIAAAPDMRAAINEADGCFEAALAEGWLDALANGDLDAIRDIWNRRLSLARSQFPAAIAKADGCTVTTTVRTP